MRQPELPFRYEIPEGTDPKPCSSCKAPMYWITTAHGQRMPVNADGISHFATCPDAANHRKAK